VFMCVSVWCVSHVALHIENRICVQAGRLDSVVRVEEHIQFMQALFAALFIVPWNGT
jgi:hypothetical protein